MNRATSIAFQALIVAAWLGGLVPAFMEFRIDNTDPTLSTGPAIIGFVCLIVFVGAPVACFAIGRRFRKEIIGDFNEALSGPQLPSLHRFSMNLVISHRPAYYIFLWLMFAMPTGYCSWGALNLLEREHAVAADEVTCSITSGEVQGTAKPRTRLRLSCPTIEHQVSLLLSPEIGELTGLPTSVTLRVRRGVFGSMRFEGASAVLR